MKYEIDIDLGPLADEWDPVEYRVPTTSETFVSWNGDISTTGMECKHPRLIVRRRWKWPEWLTAEWIAMDANLRWYSYAGEPHANATTWGYGGKCNWIDTEMFAFTPPPCTDWRQSKRRNPNAKATT